MTIKEMFPAKFGQVSLFLDPQSYGLDHDSDPIKIDVPVEYYDRIVKQFREIHGYEECDNCKSFTVGVRELTDDVTTRHDMSPVDGETNNLCERCNNIEVDNRNSDEYRI